MTEYLNADIVDTILKDGPRTQKERLNRYLIFREYGHLHDL